MKLHQLADAIERGEKIEVWTHNDEWVEWDGQHWRDNWKFRIAPKKEMTLVKELRSSAADVAKRAADRIEELEELYASSISAFATDELINEIRTRLIDKC